MHSARAVGGSWFTPRYIQSAQAWITQFYVQTTPCLPFLLGVHQMSPPQQLRQQTSNCSSLLIYRPQKDERLSWPSWLTYSGWLTHISGHPSATSRAQDSECTSAKDQCSTAGPRHQHKYSTSVLAAAVDDVRIQKCCVRIIPRILTTYPRTGGVWNWGRNRAIKTHRLVRWCCWCTICLR